MGRQRTRRRRHSLRRYFKGILSGDPSGAAVNLADFYYDLPPEQIAQEPVSPRDHSRLMTIDVRSGAIAHRQFFELDRILLPTDVLVLNATRVFPARLRGKKASGGKAEALLLGPTDEPGVWRAL